MTEPINNRLPPNDFDEFLSRTIGQFGAYQKFLVCCLCIPACFISAFGTFDLIFLSYKPEFICDESSLLRNSSSLNLIPKPNWHNDNRNESSGVTENACTVSLPGNSNSTPECKTFIYNRYYMEETITTEWNLVCDRELMSRSLFSILNGATFVAVIYSYIQDKYGRKKAFLINLTIYVLSGVASVIFPQSLPVFIAFKFINGISCMWDLCFCWALEFVGGAKNRTLITTAFSVMYGVANISLALVAYLGRYWRIVGLCTSTPFVLLFSFIFFLPESPRWLLAENRIDELLDVVLSIGRKQKIKLNRDETLRMLVGLRKNIDSASSPETVHVPSVWEFFKNKNLRHKNVVMTYVIVVANQLYGVMPYNSENLFANIFVAYSLPTLFELPATLINLTLVNRMGRVLPLSFFLTVASVCCLLTWPIGGTTEWTSLLLASLARFFLCAALGVLAQYSEELYPTVGRGVGTSVSFLASSACGLTVQYVVYSSVQFKSLPLVISGSLTLIGGFMCLFMPETLHKPLPDSIKKAEAQGAVGWKAFRENIGACRFWATKKHCDLSSL